MHNYAINCEREPSMLRMQVVSKYTLALVQAYVCMHNEITELTLCYLKQKGNGEKLCVHVGEPGTVCGRTQCGEGGQV